MWSPQALAAPVVVFPLAGDAALAAEVTPLLCAAARLHADVLDARAVEERFGFALGNQANACRHETKCLAQIAELVGAERLLIGAIAPDRQGQTALDLRVLKVPSGVVLQHLRWRFAGAPRAVIGAAVATVIAAPDARLIVLTSPADAKVRAYGAPLQRRAGEPTRFWSGVYQITASAPGYATQTLEVVVGPRETVELPLVLTSLNAPLSPEPEHGATAIENPGPWVVLGLGAAASLAGSLVMMGAQNDYNAVEDEARYISSTRGAFDARRLRDDAHDEYEIGFAILGSGVGAIAGGVLWMLIEALLPDDTSDRSR